VLDAAFAVVAQVRCSYAPLASEGRARIALQERLSATEETALTRSSVSAGPAAGAAPFVEARRGDGARSGQPARRSDR
jgi:hypothetical protein